MEIADLCPLSTLNTIFKPFTQVRVIDFAGAVGVALGGVATAAYTKSHNIWEKLQKVRIIWLVSYCTP